MALCGARGEASTLAVTPIALVLDGTVNAIVILDDGRVVIGGSFERVNGIDRKNLACLNATGAVSPIWSNGANGTVYSLAATGTQVFVGGQFSQVDGHSVDQLAKLDASTGSIDASFTNSFNGGILAMAVTNDAVYVAGYFTTVGGQPRGGLAKLNAANASLDPTFTNGANNSVFALAVDASFVYICGGFTSVGGLTRTRLAKLNAASSEVDTSFTNAADGTVEDLLLTPTALYAAGRFSNIGGQPRKYIAKLDPATSVPDPVFTNGANSYVYSLATGGSSLYAGGQFTVMGGLGRLGVAKLDATTGAVDASFTNGVGGASPAVYALASRGGSLYAGGHFSSVSGVSSPGLARIGTITGEVDAGFPASVTAPGAAYALLRQPDGKVLLGGNFTSVNGTPRYMLARLNADGTLDSTWAPMANAAVYSLALEAPSVYIGGDFGVVNGQSRSRIAKLSITNGAVITSFVCSPGPDATVRALALDGVNLYLGGGFQTLGGQNRPYLARLNASSGSLDAAFTNGASSGIWSLALSGSGLYAGGTFTTFGGASHPCMARVSTIDGSVDGTFSNRVLGINPNVYALVHDGAALYAGGNFTNVSGLNRAGLVKMDPATGYPDAAFTNLTLGSVSAILTNGSTLYMGGNFFSVAGQSRDNLARVDTATGVPDTSLTNGANGNVAAMALGDNALFVGGSFTAIDSTTAWGLAKLQPEGLWTGAADLGGGWKWLAWFGFFADQGNGWIYHNEHQWMYAVGTTSSSIWFWTADMGWLWTSQAVYPSLYRNSNGTWIWYQAGSANPRWFFNFSSQTWESRQP